MKRKTKTKRMQYFSKIYCFQYTCCLFLGHYDILNKCRLAPVNVKVDTDYDMEAIKPMPIEGIQEQKMI